MTFWQQLLTTFAGAFFGFISALVLFWVKENVSSGKRDAALVKNLMYELDYNIALYGKYVEEITKVIEAANAGLKSTYLTINYSFVARFFSIQFYQAGLIQKYLHHEDMKMWNDFLIRLSEGGQAYVMSRLEAWRKNEIAKEELFTALQYEREQIEYALKATKYIKQKIEMRK